MKTFQTLTYIGLSVVAARAASSDPVAAYGQCGGANWTGSTTCVSGWVCTSYNTYYSQCVAASGSSSSSASSTSVKTTSVPVSSTVSSATSKSTTSTSTKASSSTTTISVSKSSVSSTITTSAIASTTTKAATTTASVTTCASAIAAPSTVGTLTYVGVNIAGFDFGCDTSGSCSSGGAYPPLSSLGGVDGIGQMEHFYDDDGYNTFRLPVGWQFLTNSQATGTLDASRFAEYDQLVQACLATGASCIIDIHNYARYNGQIVGQGGPSNDVFATLWSNIAAKYASQSKIIFGIMNEPHDVPDISAWATTVQAAVTAIRKAGAIKQVILLPGNNYSSAAMFISNGSADALDKITNLDGSKTNLVFDVHQYLDSDNSGTSTECTTNNIDKAWAPLATWLRCHGRQALNTETGGGNTASCATYLCQQVAFQKANSDVILGYVGWSAGGFDSSYALSETPTKSGSTWTDTSLVSACLAPK